MLKARRDALPDAVVVVGAVGDGANQLAALKAGPTISSNSRSIFEELPRVHSSSYRTLTDESIYRLLFLARRPARTRDPCAEDTVGASLRYRVALGRS